MWQRLPAELTIEILKYCTGSDVLNFGIATGADQRIISSKKIWKAVTIIHPSDFSRCQSYLGDHTKILRIIGPSISSLSQFKSEFFISELLLNSIRQHCPMLEEMTLEFCVVDSSDIKFSMFPKTIKILQLKNIAMKNMSKDRDNSGTSPFSRIKKELPMLEKLHLHNPWYLVPYDHRAILSDNQVVPRLEIDGDDYYYTMIHVKDERVSGYDEDERQRQIDKLYNDLIAPHHYKRLRLVHFCPLGF